MPEPIITRRSASEIIHDILALCREGAVNKTTIMYQCNLSYDQVRRYLDSLCLHGLLERNQKGRFELAQEGEAILQLLERFVKILQQLHEGVLEEEPAIGAIARSAAPAGAARTAGALAKPPAPAKPPIFQMPRMR